MSDALYLPDGHGGYRQQIKKLELPPIEVPRHLQDDLAVNPKMEPKFYAAVQRALNESFHDPSTALREPTSKAVQERIELCYEALVVMRHDMKFPLKKCFDLLPRTLIEALIGGERLDDQMAKEGQDPTYWQKDKQRTDAVASGDLTPENAPHLEVEDEDSD